MSEKNNFYYVEIPVKNYVYRYLMQNFHVNVKGMKDTVSFNRCNELSQMILAMLTKNTSSFNAEDERVKNVHRNKTVKICIGRKAFEHEGFEVNQRAALSVSKHLEGMIRSDFLSYVCHMYCVEPELKRIIDRYKELNGYSEEDWPTESMSKICRRAQIYKRRKQMREFFVKQTEDFFVTQLSVLKYFRRYKKRDNETAV